MSSYCPLERTKTFKVNDKDGYILDAIMCRLFEYILNVCRVSYFKLQQLVHPHQTVTIQSLSVSYICVVLVLL